MSIPTSNKRNFLEYYIPFYLVLCNYSIGPIDLGSIGLFLALALDMAFNSRPIKISKRCKPLAFLFAYTVIRDIFKILMGRDNSSALFNYMIYYSFMFLIVFLACSTSFNEDALYKAWKIAGVIYSAGLLYHIVLIYIIGGKAEPISIIPGYSIRDVYAESRPSSFFAEPAAFASALLPLEFMALRRADYKWAIGTTLFLLLSTSSIGVILSVVLWVATVLFSKIKLAQKALITILGVAFVFAFLNMGVFSASLEKIIAVADGESTVGSRVVSGFELIQTFDFSELIFGTNFRQATSYIAANPEALPRDSHAYITIQLGESNFLNTFSYFIFSYGIIGLLAYILPLVRWFFRKTKSKTYILMMMVAIFAQGALLNSMFFSTLMILLLFSDSEEQTGEKSTEDAIPVDTEEKLDHPEN